MDFFIFLGHNCDFKSEESPCRTCKDGYKIMDYRLSPYEKDLSEPVECFDYVNEQLPAGYFVDEKERFLQKCKTKD